MEFLESRRAAEVVHIPGNTMVMARGDATFFKKLAMDYMYVFLRKICRANVPQERLINAGQVFYV